MVTRNPDTNQVDGTLPSAPTPQIDQQRSRAANTALPSAPPPQIDQQRSRAANTTLPSAPPAQIDQQRSRAANTALPSAPSAQIDQQRSRAGNTVFKNGPLFISSKGIGWTSWKKRWFILTRTSLVFFRSDPSVVSQKGSEVNLTLGGIDLNSSGSVVVREDKKLLTVLFPDGREGRAFTLKAETSEDLYEWKTALENALAQAPSAAIVMGQNAMFRNEQADTADGTVEQWRDRRPVKSLVVGRPILLALEDIDGSPSFLEKALTFIEEYGVKVEGILRQAADVDDVERRVQEYEQGKMEFSPEEDAHIIADCVKHVIRELPSSPVPASCCNALLEACRTDRGGRVNAMRTAILETFPEPNRRLLQRILQMMQIVASHKSVNRMSLSAVAACMAPLLLRPLLAGDCELENDFNVGGDGSLQLLQAAAAANHAQAIVITLMEDYHDIFEDDSLLEGSISSDMYTDSEESGSEEEEQTDDDDDDDDEILNDDGYHDSRHDLDVETEEDPEGESQTDSEDSDNEEEDLHENKVSECSESDYGSAEVKSDCGANPKTSNETQNPKSHDANLQNNGNLQNQINSSSVVNAGDSPEALKEVHAPASPGIKSTDRCMLPCITQSDNLSNESMPVRRRTIWGRTPARKNLSMESIDFPAEDEIAIQQLEVTKIDLQNRIVKEANENAILHESLERRKETLHERRLALEQDVTRLQEQLQKEQELRAAMEAGLKKPLGRLPISTTIDDKTKAELEEIALAEADVNNLKQRVADLNEQLNKQQKDRDGSLCESCGQLQNNQNHQAEQKDQQKDLEITTDAPLNEKSRGNEDDAVFREDSEKVRKQEPPCLPNPQLDCTSRDGTAFASASSSKKSALTIEVGHDSTKPTGASSSSSVQPVIVSPTAALNSKKLGGKVGADHDIGTSNSKKSGSKIETVHDSSKSVAAVCSWEPGMAGSSAASSSKKSGAKTEAGQDSTKFSAEMAAVLPPTPNSKKSGSKIEGAASTTSALSKLTTRLNFLKERRTQIVNELQNIETDRGTDTPSIGAPPRTNSR